MKKQTAVEWFNQQIIDKQNGNGDLRSWDEIFEQAKAMEKEQIVEAWNGGNYGYFYSKGTKEDFNDGSEYYNEVYKGGEQ